MKKYLPKSLSNLLALPIPPSDSYLKKCSYETVKSATQEFLSAWKQVSGEYDELCGHSESYKCPNCGKEHELSDTDLWSRKFLILGTYYDYSVRQLMHKEKETKNSSLPPGLNLHAHSQFVDKCPDLTHQPDAAIAHLIIARYLTCIFSTYFTGQFRSFMNQNSPLSVFEESAHDAVLSLHDFTRTAPHRNLRQCSNTLVQGALSLLKSAYSSEKVTWNKDHQLGPFSALHTHELALLATRDKKLSNKYGNKHIEKVFEKQLALLFQSFGFYVVSTREGQRTIDLICISSDPREPMTILVEAKTSGRPYGLPVKDQRALIEYVNDVRKSLTTLPPLAFVLITGPKPSSTIEKRLSELEAELQTPTRYITATELSSVRECVPGALPLEIFRKKIILSDTKLLSDLGNEILNAYQVREQAHSDLVRTMLGGVPDVIHSPRKKSKSGTGESSHKKNKNS